MNFEVALHELGTFNDEQRDELLRRTEDDLSSFVEKVAPIIEQVRLNGDAALVDFAREFDGADISHTEIAATPEDFAAAYKQLDPEFIEVLKYFSRQYSQISRQANA